jgi:hypothetical protein
VLPVADDDPRAKVTALARPAISASSRSMPGPLAMARYLKPFAMLWTRSPLRLPPPAALAKGARQAGPRRAGHPDASQGVPPS